MYYAGKFASNLDYSVRNLFKLRRSLRSEVRKYKYLITVDFGNKNIENPSLLNFLKAKGIKIDFKLQDNSNHQYSLGFTKGDSINYDYITTDEPINPESIIVSSNANIYVKWIVVSPLETNEKTQFFYPVFKSVKRMLVELYDTTKIPNHKVNEEYVVQERENTYPVCRDFPWYEFASYVYFDLLRIYFQSFMCIGKNILTYFFTNYFDSIYNGIPIPYGKIADREILFGKVFQYYWQIGDSSLLPYMKNDKYDRKLTELDVEINDDLFICDLTSFKDVKVRNGFIFNRQLIWGVCVFQHKEGYLRPVLIDLSDKLVSNRDDKWLDALDMMQSGQLLVSIFYHVALIHEFNEFLSTVFKRNITPNHPIYQLIEPFTDGAISGGVFNRANVASSLVIFKSSTYEEISTKLYDKCTYDDLHYISYLKKSGFNEKNLSSQPITRQLREFWLTLYKFVDTYVDVVYEKNKVETDQSVINWFADLRVYKAFNQVKVNKQTLKEVLNIQMFQTFIHWSDHNQVYDLRTDPTSATGYYAGGNQFNKLIKIYVDYIFYIANYVKYEDDHDMPSVLDNNKFGYIGNERLLNAYYDFAKSLHDIEKHSLLNNNVRESLTLKTIYRSSLY